MFKRLSLIALSCLLVSACTGGGYTMPRERIERALVGAPGLAQPSRVVAAELAYARAAKANGLTNAMMEFAGTNAIIHLGGGPIAAGLAPKSGTVRGGAINWSPRVVVMSCDGSLAVSQGRFRDAANIVGNYVTVWQRINATDYRWVYDVAGPDIPQPPRSNLSDASDAIITVEALDSVQGLVADCPRAGQALPPPPEIAVAAAQNSGSFASPDGTLRWRWEHRADGKKHVAADHLTSGAWETVIEQVF